MEAQLAWHSVGAPQVTWDNGSLMNYSYPHPLPPRIFPHIDAYILTLLQTNESTNIGPMLPQIPHMLPGNGVAHLVHGPVGGLEHGDLPYGMEPVIPQMQMNTSNFIRAPPHGHSQNNFQDGVDMEWSAAPFSFPTWREVCQDSAS